MKKLYAIQVPVDIDRIIIWEDLAYFETPELRDLFVETYLYDKKQGRDYRFVELKVATTKEDVLMTKGR